MNKRILFIPIFISILILMSPVSVRPDVLHIWLGFEDTNSSTFSLGEFNRTILSAGGGEIELNYTDAGNSTRVLSGNFTSRIFDAGSVHYFRTIHWDEELYAPHGHNITIRTRAGNATPLGAWSGYVENQELDSIGTYARYAQYIAFLETQNGLTTPQLKNVTVFYSEVIPDVTLVSPAYGSTSATGNATFNCSAYSVNGLANMTLYWNYSGTWEANGTQSLSGNRASASFNRTGLAAGKSFVWNCMAYDQAGQWSFAYNPPSYNNFSLRISGGDAGAPSIVYRDISPDPASNGSDVQISINASDDTGVDSVWAHVSLPNGTQDNITLVNNGTVNYTASIAGTYSVIFFANDTGGNTTNATDSFTVQGPTVYFDVNVIDYNQSGVDTELIIYSAGTDNEVDSFTSQDGTFENQGIPDGTYDFLFKAHGDDLQILLRSIDVSENLNRTIGLDMLSVPVSGYGVTYAIENNYTFSSAQITLYYDESDFQDEDNLGVYKCDNWEFNNQVCSGSWSSVTAAQNEAQDYFTVETTSLSAFSIGQESYCGDGTCDSDETISSCPDDCQCTEGQTQTCGTTDVGPCEYGTQTCTGGSWGSCTGAVEPQTELCNGVDDDCDGTVDNLNGDMSVDETKCQCYDNGMPMEEDCNGIDDNCDGTVDENLQRECGSSVGICTPGTSTCSDGIWTECIGGVSPSPQEICENQLDDNCDGIVDEECASCYNGVHDGNEEGIDCGGSCQEPCPVFPWYILVIVGAVAMAAVVVYWWMTSSKKKEKVTWEELEKKYGKAQRYF